MKTIGILFADEMEYKPFLQRAMTLGGIQSIGRGRNMVKCFYNGANTDFNLIAVQCGIGKVNAAAATAYLIADHAADIILNAGLSGAVSGFHRGDIVAGETYTECDFDLSALDVPPGQKPNELILRTADISLFKAAMKIDGVQSAALGTGDQFLADNQKKNYYLNLFGITAFDMETAAVASVCSYANIPFLCIRKISDNADESATDDYTEMNDKAETNLTDVLFKLFEILDAG